MELRNSDWSGGMPVDKIWRRERERERGSQGERRGLRDVTRVTSQEPLHLTGMSGEIKLSPEENTSEMSREDLGFVIGGSLPKIEKPTSISSVKSYIKGEYIHFQCIVMGPCRKCVIGD